MYLKRENVGTSLKSTGKAEQADWNSSASAQVATTGRLYIQINLSSALRFFQQTQSGLPVFRTIFYFKSTNYHIYKIHSEQLIYLYLNTWRLEPSEVDTELYHSVIKFPFPFLYCI